MGEKPFIRHYFWLLQLKKCSRRKVFVLPLPFSATGKKVFKQKNSLGFSVRQELCSKGWKHCLRSSGMEPGRDTPRRLDRNGKRVFSSFNRKGLSRDPEGGERGGKGWETVQGRLCGNYTATPWELHRNPMRTGKESLEPSSEHRNVFVSKTEFC